MKNTILCARDVSKIFLQDGKEIQILTDIDINIYEGDFTVIMGPSGAGKSTLLYILSGMDSITNGSVKFQGKEISKLSEKKWHICEQMNLALSFSKHTLSAI